MQKLLSFFVDHEILKILLTVEFNKMYLVWFVNPAFDKGFRIRSHTQQKPATVFSNDWYGHIFKFMKCFFLAFFNVNQLRDVDHFIYFLRVLCCLLYTSDAA